MLLQEGRPHSPILGASNGIHEIRSGSRDVARGGHVLSVLSVLSMAATCKPVACSLHASIFIPPSTVVPGCVSHSSFEISETQVVSQRRKSACEHHHHQRHHQERCSLTQRLSSSAHSCPGTTRVRWPLCQCQMPVPASPSGVVYPPRRHLHTQTQWPASHSSNGEVRRCGDRRGHVDRPFRSSQLRPPATASR